MLESIFTYLHAGGDRWAFTLEQETAGDVVYYFIGATMGGHLCEPVPLV